MIERFMIKAHLFINGYSGHLLHCLRTYIHVGTLKTDATKSMICSNTPRRAGLETFYAALLISTIEQLLSSNNALPKAFIIPAESCIFKWLGI